MSPEGSVLYVAIGAALVPHAVDAAALTLAPRPGVTLPAAVQYVWFHPRLPLLYAAYSARAAGGDTHGVAALRIDPASGALSAFGAPLALDNRPVHVTLNPAGDLLLVTCNLPAVLIPHRLGPDGAIGPALPRQDSPGVFPHQARFLPDGRHVVVPARGNDASPGRAGDPGALGVFRCEDGRLSRVAGVTLGDGLAFGPRHVALHPTRPWLYAAVERGNLLACFETGAGGLAATPVAVVETLPGGAQTGAPEQYAGAVHVHPDGRHVYVINRSDGSVMRDGQAVRGAGENSIACFAIDAATGAPSLRARVPTHGIHCRSFAIDPSARMLVAASVAPMAEREGDGVRVVTAGLSVFAMQRDGGLSFVRKYDAPPGAGPVFWCGMRHLG